MKLDSGVLLTTDAARILDVAPDTVRALERRGVLSAQRTPSGVRLFARQDVERLAQERERSRASIVSAESRYMAAPEVAPALDAAEWPDDYPRPGTSRT